MPNTDKLLSIKNLKKYFPVAKTKLFQKEQLYVRANEEITIDIKKGETFGLVGESGCGKSTLGRTLLQLYDQTAGSTLYYGRTLEDFAPEYVRDTLKHSDKMLAKYHKMEAKAKHAADECDSKGASATFFDHQQKNLTAAEADTMFQSIVKILGGIVTLDDAKRHKGCELLLAKYNVDTKVARLKATIRELESEIGFEISQIKSIKSDATVKNPASKIAKSQKKADAFNRKKDELTKQLTTLEAASKTSLDAIRAFKEPFRNDEKFMECEGMLDNGIDLSRLSYDEMRILRKDIQIIFQDPYSSLNPRMTIGQIIEEGLVTHKYFKHGSPEMKEYILEVMRQCGLQDYMIHRYPHQFSGGQRQRICIARALAVQPQFIVCDECVSALDVSIQSQIINLLEELKKKQNLTYLFISHDLSVVRYISDRIGVMYLGNMVELGSAETVFSDPRHPYTVALLSSIPTTDAESLKKERILLEGNIPSPIHPPEGCKFHTRCYMACEKCKRVPPPYTEIEPGHFVACHFPEKKLDENGNYLFEIPERQKIVRADQRAGK